jgi:cyclopropane fatty-acyl-phospholipid synthase-like methyltransferase
MISKEEPISMAKNKDNSDSKQSAKQDKKAKNRAQKADRHTLYQDSVQCVEAEIDFVDATFERLRGRKATVLREDFCGTAITSCEWVMRREGNSAIGVDLDPEVLAWGSEHNIAKLGDCAHQITLFEQNVLDARHAPVDTVLAMNFSYWMFKERATLRDYFRCVHDSMVADGIFFLDCYGGYDASREMRERTKNDGFTYVWDQASFNPINSHMRCHIHFHFDDGSKLNKAFTYDWRLWTLPEIKEILEEAGFSTVSFWWQGWDEEEADGDGEYEPVEEADADAAWVCYIVGEK